MNQCYIEALPIDIWYSVLRYLDPAESALLALCSKTTYNATNGSKLMKHVNQCHEYRHKFLLSLEQDLPIEYLYCSADIKFHRVRLSTQPDGLDPFVVFPYYKIDWACVLEDNRNETSLFLGSGLRFHQARMLLKLFERQHPLAQKYLDSLSLCQITNPKPCNFLQRELLVRWIPGHDRPSLFARIQHWFFIDYQYKALRTRDSLNHPFPKLMICYHYPKEVPSRRRFHASVVAEGSSRVQSIIRCNRCGTESRLDTLDLPNPPRLYLSSYLPTSMGRPMLDMAFVFTKWMNLGSLEAQSSREWRRFAYVSDSARRELRGFCSPKRAFEFFEGEDALALEKEGKDAYKPVWTKELEKRVKDRLRLARR